MDFMVEICLHVGIKKRVIHLKKYIFWKEIEKEFEDVPCFNIFLVQDVTPVTLTSHPLEQYMLSLWCLLPVVDVDKKGWDCHDLEFWTLI